MVLHICVRFHDNILNGFQLTERQEYMVEMAVFNVQRPITLKVGIPEL